MADDSIIDRFLDRWQEEIEAGRTPDLEAICAECPSVLPELRRRVEAFQKMDNRLWKFMDEPTQVSGGNGSADQHTSPATDSTLFSATVKYRICSTHARGGLGEVLIAEDESLRRRVALKRMHGDQILDPVRRQRFLREAAITGQLDHPGIVAIHSVGEGMQGNPCYVMKFIDGETLSDAVRRLHDEFRKSERRSTQVFQSIVLRPLLTRFVAVCNTVGFAHHAGFIHRDIKPANIMLGEFGATYVVDWGLAKSISATHRQNSADQPDTNSPRSPNSDTASEETVVYSSDQTAPEIAEVDLFLTQPGTVVGTPAYMSPEQSRGDSASVGKASDIYSLGATLYFLLTAESRFASDGGYSWIEQIQSGDFPTPCIRQPFVPPALESICLRAMSLRPEDRYSSALELAVDVERWMIDEPVSAHAEGLVDRAGRFFRRHRSLTISLLMASVLIVTTAIAATILINREKNDAIVARTAAQDAAAAEKEAKGKAERRLLLVERSNSILASVFVNLNPEEVAKNETPLQALLAQQITNAAEGLADDSESDPLIVADLQNKLGSSLINLSEPSRAIPILRQALQHYESVHDRKHRDVIACQFNLASALLASGNLAESIPMMEEGLKQTRAVLEDSDPLKSKAMNILGSAYLDAGRVPDANALFSEALQLRKQHLGLNHPDTVTSMNDLAMGYGAAGKREDALKLLQEVVQLSAGTFGPDDPRTLSGSNNLAIALLSAGRPEESLPLFEETLTKRRKTLGRTHIDTLGSMNNLAANYQTLSKWKDALPLLEEASDLTGSKFGPEHPAHLVTLNNLAFASLRMELPEKAIPLFQQILGTRIKVLGNDHPDTISTVLNLGLSYVAGRQPEKGLPMLEAAFESRRTRLGPDHPKTIEALVTTTSEYEKANRRDDAERLFQSAVEKFPAEQKQQSAAYAQILAGFGQLRLKAGHGTEAEPLLRECFQIRAMIQPKTVQTFSTESMLGEALLAGMKYDEAEQHLLSGYEGLKAQADTIPSQQSVRIPEAITRLVRLYEETNRPDLAQQWKTLLPKSP
ncbi:MAG: tetratricopeptide repeat protein [Planctomycetaceae bacterium]